MKNLSFIAAAAAFAEIVEREYLAALAENEDNPRLDKLGDLGNLIASCLAEAPAQSLEDMVAKAVVMKIQLPEGRWAGGLWPGASEQERLAWSMAEDALRLAAQKFKPDPAVGAAEAYFNAVQAVNSHPGQLGDAEFDQLFQVSEAAAADAYRTKPTTRAGAHAFLDMLLDHQAGCMADDETEVALDTLRNCLGSL